VKVAADRFNGNGRGVREIIDGDVDFRRSGSSYCRTVTVDPESTSGSCGSNNSFKGELTMRVMVMVKATSESEAGKMPGTELLAAMGNFNEELVKAGVMLAGEGLHPSARGKRVRFSGSQRTVIDGPFAETKELVAGFWLWQVKSMEEAVEWVKRCPNPMESESEIEIRPLFEADDFGAEFTPELRAQEEHLRAEAEGIAHKPR
jgi:hypothetical protein